MRVLILITVCFVINSCKAQEYRLQFSDRKDNVVLTLKKAMNQDTQCFTFSDEEKDNIQRYNLNDGRLIIYEGNIEKHKFVIINVYTSNTYKEKILLCQVDGKLKFQEPICVGKVYCEKE